MPKNDEEEDYRKRQSCNTEKAFACILGNQRLTFSLGNTKATHGRVQNEMAYNGKMCVQHISISNAVTVKKN